MEKTNILYYNIIGDYMEMIEEVIQNTISILQTIGPISGIILIILESIIPILPLAVFIALNVTSFGYLFGFIISWISTCIGCMIAFTFFRYFFRGKLENYLDKKKSKNIKKAKKIKKRIDTIPFTNLVLITALPFTPAFLINIAAGLSKISKRKFILAILIGKLSITYFWGYIGKSFIDSMMDINTIIKICLLLVVSYVISKFVGKKMHIE